MSTFKPPLFNGDSINLDTLWPDGEQPANQQELIAALLERWQQEKAGRLAAEKRYQELFNHSPAMMVYIQDENGEPVIADCNRMFWKKLGYQREELVGQSLLQFYTPASQEAFNSSQNGYQAALRGELRQAERELIAKDGHIIYTYLHAVADIADENGRSGLRAMYIDITERKVAEKNRHSLEKMFLAAFMYSPIPMIITTLENNEFINANDSFSHFISPHYGSLLGKRIEDVIDLWSQRDNYQQFINEFDRNDRVRNFETEYRLLSGHTGTALISSELITVGESTYVLSTIQDISQRKELESSLRGLADRLQAINDIERSLLSAKSAERVAQVALLNLTQLVPFSLGVVYRYGSDLENAVVLASTAEADSPVAVGKTVPCPNSAGQSGAAQPIYYTSDIMKLPQRSAKHELLLAEGVRSTIFVVFVVEGQLIGALHLGAAEPRAFNHKHLNIVREVADLLTTAVHQVNLQEELNDYTQTLEEKVQSRTAELHLANAELARANRLKDEFLANMSHELRTPLTGILAKTESFQEGIFGPLNEKQSRSIDVIDQSGRHLLALINDILDLAKIGAGHMELHTMPTPVVTICDSSLAMVRDMAMQKHITVEMNELPPNLKMDADPQRLKQMLVNLLSNAVKFTPEGGQIGLEVIVDEPAKTIHFAIWDTGIGIAEEKMESLFTPFVQLDGGLSRQYEGTGLGLALVSRLTKLHGGTVSVESQVDAGSRFTISLPLTVPAKDVLAETAVSNGWYYDEDAIEKLPFHILLVEDNLMTAEAFVEYLEYLDYTVSVANNGQIALDMIAETHPDLILMDIQMPGMDGLEAIQRIRRDPEQSQIPIVAVTALAMPGDEERCLRAGANEYASKPIPIAKLRELVQKYEGQRNSHM